MTRGSGVWARENRFVREKVGQNVCFRFMSRDNSCQLVSWLYIYRIWDKNDQFTNFENKFKAKSVTVDKV